MRNAAQIKAIDTVLEGARRLIEEIDSRTDSAWTDFTAYFHLHCGEEKFDDNNYWRDQYGNKRPINMTTPIFKSVHR